MYIPEQTVTEINNTADAIDVARNVLNLHLKDKSTGGAGGDCPFCQGKKKFSIMKLGGWKCFVCEEKGSGGVSLYMKVENKTYPQALEALAKHYNITIPEQGAAIAAERASLKKSFRDLQLLESGIPEAEQKWQEKRGSTTLVERDRYERGTITSEWRITTDGDDMLLNYIGLNGEPMMYKDKSGRDKYLVRVRYQRPDLHLDKDGKPVKYRSLPGSPSALWLPQRLLKAYAQGVKFDTLFVSEGEKKADKMTLHDMYTCGLQGINNLNYEGMTSIFEQIIKKCEVKNVVFVVDSDWQDISKGDDVDYRPRSFFSALKKFRDYFYGYKNGGLEMNIYFAYGKDTAFKGLDDLLTRGLQAKEQELLDDFNFAMVDREGQGAHVDVVNMTTISDYKIEEMFCLHDTQAFLEKHEAELKTRREFRVKRLRYRWNEQDGKFEMVEKILESEKFWDEEVIETRGKSSTKYTFNYYRSWNFFRNRGIGLYEFDKKQHQYRIIKLDGKIVREIDAHFIQQYVKTFVEELEGPGRIPILNMLARGGSQYMGPFQLGNLHYITPEFMQPQKECTYMIFQNCYWRITADGVEERPLNELDKFTWEQKIIPFDARYLGAPLLQVGRAMRDGEEVWTAKEREWTEGETKRHASDCVFYRLLLATSNFWWRKEYKLEKGEDGLNKWVPKSKDEREAYTREEIDQMRTHLVCKMLAIGYTLQGYRDKAQTKAIVAMDGVESAVGRSMGGTGKSIVATQFENVFHTFVIDGKKDGIERDPFIFEGVDDRTGAIIFDDTKVNFNFEWLFSKITTGVEVNGKNIKQFRVAPLPIWVVTNHAINGDSDSFTRRQYPIAFSDYFSAERTPFDEFGHTMFTDWDADQWNLYYNYLANCIQVFLRFPDLKKYTIPKADLERRRIRQAMGENFLEFAEVYFARKDDEPAPFDPHAPGQGDAHAGPFRNAAVSKTKILNDYLEQFKADRSYINAKKIKEKVELFCKYKGLQFNPIHGADGRLKINGTEYLIVADHEFNADNYEKIA
ncbi:MAG: hypothetical protein JNM22_05545 [Saprospiraceae bacterium]|nr:hypothetical protein [Saprospiraceae bacterium]